MVKFVGAVRNFLRACQTFFKNTTAQLYCTLSTCITPKTISRQNQKTNTTRQLYGERTETVVLKEYYNYSSISTSIERSQYF